MPRPIRFALIHAVCVSCTFALPLPIDLTVPVPAPEETPMGFGTVKNLQGHLITADSRSFFLDGVPWIPVVGEFHYARYPKAEWREELMKMKAGGINVVSSYVVWIHHEEERGRFEWSGDRSLHDFLILCRELGLKCNLRMGPWSHGEVRNGGFPDWVQKSGTPLRKKNPEFLALVEPFFREQAKQMKGLLWKDGGPVIGVQMDNESDQGDYLLALKDMARAAGVDVPIYSITGWQGGVPEAGLLPVFGGYVDGFWGGRLEDYRKEFIFTKVRAMNDLGAQLTTKNERNSKLLEKFPYGCAEIGPGMMSSYAKRIKILPQDVAALALAKLGCGNNMPGYYMYQGGVNPEGKLSTLQEDRPNQMPVKDYDFQTALGACGQVREQYHLLRQQHLFLEDFGARLARMPVFLPDRLPAGLNDCDTVRWSVRADEKGSGFIFFTNRQPTVPMPGKNEVQFTLKTAAGQLMVPRTPIALPSGSYGLWPVNLDCDGVMLEYATAQLLCRVEDADGRPTYFFTALENVRPELALQGAEPKVVTAGTGVALDAKNPAGKSVSFVVLAPHQGMEFYRESFAGRPRAILSNATLLAGGPLLSFQSDLTSETKVALFPPTAAGIQAKDPSQGSAEGVFSQFVIPTSKTQTIAITARLTKPAGPLAKTLKGNEEATWTDAAVYKVAIPVSVQDSRLILDFHYIGDAARLYVDGKLFMDHFFNGDPLSVALWRIRQKDWDRIELKVLPYSEALSKRLPDSAIKKAKEATSLDQVIVTVIRRSFATLAAP